MQLQKATDKNVKQAAVVKRKTEEVQAVHRRLADMTERKQAAAIIRESKPQSKQPTRVDAGQRPPSTPSAAKRVPFKRKVRILRSPETTQDEPLVPEFHVRQLGDGAELGATEGNSLGALVGACAGPALGACEGAQDEPLT